MDKSYKTPSYNQENRILRLRNYIDFTTSITKFYNIQKFN